MAMTGMQAWQALTDREKGYAKESAMDAFLLGFQAGWQAQENRPFHCLWCGTEITGETDGETIALAQDHSRACEVNPLAIENRQLRGGLRP